MEYDITEKIKELVHLMDEIDNIINNQPLEIQKVDYELSDLEHLIENNELSLSAKDKVVNRMHELRMQRRRLKEENEIEKTYNTHKSKLTGKDTRQFLIIEIHKTIKALNTQYKNRVLTDEDIKYYLEEEPVIIEKKKRGRPRKEVESNE